MTDAYIVILGDIHKGLRFFGPYESYIEACEEAESAKEKWQVVPLYPAFWPTDCASPTAGE